VARSPPPRANAPPPQVFQHPFAIPSENSHNARPQEGEASDSLSGQFRTLKDRVSRMPYLLLHTPRQAMHGPPRFFMEENT
jgi:hypothetical protein